MGACSGNNTTVMSPMVVEMVAMGAPSAGCVN